MRGMFRTAMLMFVLVFGVASVTMAEEGAAPAKAKAKTTQTKGELVRVGDGQIVVAVKASKDAAAVEKAFTISPETPVSLERKKAKLQDLKPGMAVTIGVGDDGTIKGVNAGYPRIMGNFVRLENGAIVLSVKAEDKPREVVVAVAPTASVTVDGRKDASLGDLTKGMRITVPKVDSPVEVVVAKSAAGGKAGAPKKDGAPKDKKEPKDKKQGEPAGEDAM